MYKPLNYRLHELAHPQIINDIGEVNTWLRLDSDCLKDLQNIREEWYLINRTGIYINRLDLLIDSRGLRPPNDPDGSFYSIHKQGKAFDLEAVNGKNKRLFDMINGMIKANKLLAFNTVEEFSDTKNWVHVAKMNTEKRPLIIKP